MKPNMQTQQSRISPRLPRGHALSLGFADQPVAELPHRAGK